MSWRDRHLMTCTCGQFDIANGLQGFLIHHPHDWIAATRYIYFTSAVDCVQVIRCTLQHLLIGGKHDVFWRWPCFERTCHFPGDWIDFADAAVAAVAGECTLSVAREYRYEYRVVRCRSSLDGLDHLVGVKAHHAAAAASAVHHDWIPHALGDRSNLREPPRFSLRLFGLSHSVVAV